MKKFLKKRSWQKGRVDQESFLGWTGNIEGSFKVGNHKFIVKSTFPVVLGLFQKHWNSQMQVLRSKWLFSNRIGILANDGFNYFIVYSILECHELGKCKTKLSILTYIGIW